ncbi:MAG: hypothetical protein AB7V13_21020 [Pseudorhodoplanes sp.]|uniref:hypothetical protein n=1 Tax=Pseudorhodoplanes sp. TaxID=1934341 RepID=UPI003D12571F
MTSSDQGAAYGFMFPDDGSIPNNPALPFLFYPRAFDLTSVGDPAAMIEAIIRSNGWGRTWRDGIYPFAHYHPRIHEALAIARGRANVRFGGAQGEEFGMETGDAAVLPAGTGHQCIDASDDLIVVGAYPPEGIYDLSLGSRAEYERAVAKIPGVKRPDTDPFFGRDGPLIREWR